MPDELFDAEFLQRLEVLRVVARRRFQGTSAGQRTGRRSGPGLEFAEHREYASGDDFRYVDWAAYGRLDRLLLRLFQVEEDLSVFFLVDASASMAAGDPPAFDQARRIAAALAMVALAGLEEVRLFAVAGGGVRAHHEAGRGRGHILGVLDFLREQAAEGPTDLAASVDAFLPHAPRAGMAVLVSDLMDEAGYEKALTALHGRRFDLWVVHVVKPDVEVPQGAADLTLTDAETGEEVPVQMTPELAERMRAEQRRFADEARSWCRSRGIGYVRAPTDTPAADLVLDVLRRGGLLA